MSSVLLLVLVWETWVTTTGCNLHNVKLHSYTCTNSSILSITIRSTCILNFFFLQNYKSCWLINTFFSHIYSIYKGLWPWFANNINQIQIVLKHFIRKNEIKFQVIAKKHKLPLKYLHMPWGKGRYILCNDLVS